jgi:NRPS condensation-like uncharacterized protein
MRRPLGGNELLTWLYGQAHCINCPIVARVRGPLEASSVRRALDALQARHPLLGARVGWPEQAAEFIFGDAAPIPLRVVAREDETHWQREMDHEFNEPFAADRAPLVRVVLLQGNGLHELVLTFHHVVGDGYGAIYLMRDLLEASAAGLAGGTPQLSPLPLRASLEALLPARLQGMRGWARGLRTIGSMLWEMRRFKTRKLPDEAPGEPGKRRTRVHYVEIPPEAFARIQESCRTERTTLHGALCAALLKAVARRIPRDGGPGAPVDLGCFSPVSARDMLEPPLSAEEFGLYTGSVASHHRLTESTSLWELSREVREKVRQAKQLGDILLVGKMQGNMVRKQRALKGSQLRALEDPFLGAVMVTNLGALDIPTRYGPLELERLGAGVSTGQFGSLLGVAVATLQGIVQLNFLYAEPQLTEARVREITTEALTELFTLCGLPTSELGDPQRLADHRAAARQVQ